MGYRLTLLKELIWPHLRVRVSDVTELLTMLDKDQDGYISINELIEWCGVKIK